MKLIKLFDAFGLPPKKSDEEVRDLIQLLNDIFLELSDEGFDIEFSHFSLTDKLGVTIRNDKDFKYVDIYETMLTAQSHMKEHGYFLDRIEASYDGRLLSAFDNLGGLKSSTLDLLFNRIRIFKIDKLTLWFKGISF